MDNKTISGIDLSERFFYEVVKSVVDTEFPDLRYAAALLGPGSEVLGLDDDISKDHDWGLRLFLFIEESEFDYLSITLDQLFKDRLPYSFLGHSTNWVFNEDKTMRTEFTEEGEVNHRIEIHSVKSYLQKYLGIDNSLISEKDWLLIPEQRLLEFTSGKIFFNNQLGELNVARSNLLYFPDNVWKYKILSQWCRISEEIAFVGRTRMLGDELGSRLETSRLIRMIIEMAFILKRKYIPYPKWMTTLFMLLPTAKTLHPLLMELMNEIDQNRREELLCDAYLMLLDEQNKLEITPSIEGKLQSYYNRPQTIINIKEIINELNKVIDEPLKDLKKIGSLDQFIDNATIQSDSKYARNAKGFFE
jgi:hypothetical protein